MAELLRSANIFIGEASKISNDEWAKLVKILGLVRLELSISTEREKIALISGYARKSIRVAGGRHEVSVETRAPLFLDAIMLKNG